MKQLLSICCCFWLAALHGQTSLSSADWQSDLRFLQTTVHQDYPFLFKKISAADWDKSVEQLYAEIPKMQPHEIEAGFARIVSSFLYGHTSIGWFGGPVKYHVAPVNVYWFSDGLYIEGVQKDYANALGARILKVEGKPVEEALAAIRPLVPAENDAYFKAYGLDFLVIPEALHAQHISSSLKSDVTMTLEKDGKTFEQTFQAQDAFHLPRDYGFVHPGPDWESARKQEQTPLYLKHLDRNYYFEYLPDSKTVYVRQSQVLDDKDESIADFYGRVFDFIDKNDVEKLVIDVRLNGGGNNYKNKPVVTGVIACRKINQPGKFFVITGRRTFSACQNLVNEFQNYTNVIFIGEPTAENINFYGDNRPVELPNSKLNVRLSFAWWQDKPQWENADWLAPQIATDLSFAQYCSNHDPAMEAILGSEFDSKYMDPLRYLRSLLEQGRMDEMKAAAKAMTADNRLRYFDFEDRINQAGYDLMGAGKLDQALSVFQLNAELFPQSANCWDSLGEAAWKSGKKEKAIEYYNKSIMLDPKGATGENSKHMLEQIKNGK